MTGTLAYHLLQCRLIEHLAAAFSTAAESVTCFVVRVTPL
jgi:hypothetical protein